MLTALSIEEFAAKLASESSPPGGGSAAALTGLIAGGVLELVINVSLEKSEQHGALLKTKLAETQILSSSLKKLIDKDAEVFQQLLAVLDIQENGTRATELAFQRAAETPLEIATAGLAMLELAKQLIGKIEACVISDLMTSAAGAHAAITGALCSTAVNLPGIKDETTRQALTKQIESLSTAAESLLSELKQALYSEKPFDILQNKINK